MNFCINYKQRLYRIAKSNNKLLPVHELCESCYGYGLVFYTLQRVLLYSEITICTRTAIFKRVIDRREASVLPLPVETYSILAECKCFRCYVIPWKFKYSRISLTESVADLCFRKCIQYGSFPVLECHFGYANRKIVLKT